MKLTLNHRILLYNCAGYFSNSSSGVATGGASAGADETDKLDMPPPPSPASSTCSDSGSIGSPATYKRTVKRSAPRGDSADRQMLEEEEWPLKDVVFLEDTKPTPVGEVLAVDGDQVVIIPYNKDGKQSSSGAASGSSSIIGGGVGGNLRVIHRDQLTVLRAQPTSSAAQHHGSYPPRAPDCYQKTPKRVPIPEGGSSLLAVAVDNRGVHCLVQANSGSGGVSYIVHNLCNGKLQQEYSLPTDSQAFLANQPHKVKIAVTGESEGVCVVLDGNSTVYPVNREIESQQQRTGTGGGGGATGSAGNSSNNQQQQQQQSSSVPSLREPVWPDLPPVLAVSATQHFLHAASSVQKNTVALLVLSLSRQPLLSPVLSGDLEGVNQALLRLEHCEGSLLQLAFLVFCITRDHLKYRNIWPLNANIIIIINNK